MEQNCSKSGAGPDDVKVQTMAIGKMNEEGQK